MTTKEAILKAYDQYTLKYGKFPSFKDINSIGELPKHTTIKKYFNMTVVEFRKKYYGNYKVATHDKFDSDDGEKWLNFFKKEYVRLGKPTARGYDKGRKIQTPCSSYLMKIAGVTKWNDLLLSCGFKPKWDTRKRIGIITKATPDLEFLASEKGKRFREILDECCKMNLKS